jgi:hypothetical protein
MAEQFAYTCSGLVKNIGSTTDALSLHGAKDLKEQLGSNGLHARPRIRAVYGAAKHPTGA